MPRRQHEGQVTNELGELLSYKGARPSAGQLYDLLGVHIRNVERGPEAPPPDDREATLARLADARREKETELAVIFEINGTPARDHDAADVTQCYNDLMGFYSAAANSEATPPPQENSADEQDESPTKAKAQRTR